MMIRARTFFFVALLIAVASAFLPPAHKARSMASSSSTALEERRWNFNEGQSPWGMKQNAEIWNGRFAQVRIYMREKY